MVACSTERQTTDSPETGVESTTSTPTTTESSSPALPSEDGTADPATTSTTVLQQLALADLSDVQGRLVTRDERGNLTTLRPNGADRQELASGEASLLTQPTWSHDGERVAWSAIDENGAALAISDIDGTNQLRAPLESPAFYLAWSPDDSWVAGLRPIAGNIEFLIADASAATVRAAGTGQPFYFDWRDDNSVIAVIDSTTLAEISTTGDASPTPVEVDSSLGLFQAPAVVIAADGSPIRAIIALLRDGANDVVSFGPGEDKSIGRTTGPFVVAMNPVSQEVAVLVVETEAQSQVINFQADQPPSLPSGRVSVIDLESGEVTTRPERDVLAVQWSPDGSRLALLQAGNDALQWLVADSQEIQALTAFVPSPEFATSYLPFADQYNHSTTWWSPDSRAMVMSGAVAGERGVWIDLVDDDLGAVLVSGGDLAVWSPR